MSQLVPLKSGDTIGIAASASPFDREVFEGGLRVLKHFGFKIFYHDSIFAKERYLAGSDQRRADELMALFADPSIAAIMFARGGYGSQRIIPLLDPTRIKRHPKPVVGFSDLTALLSWLATTCSTPTFYGPVITQLSTAPQMTIDGLWRAITTRGPLGLLPMADAKILRPGKAHGTLIGGCLSLLTSSMGTAYEVVTDGAILFIEETGEKPYSLDRMLTQLKNAGKLARVHGIVIGSIVLPQGNEPEALTQMLSDILSDFPGPVIMNFPAGHSDLFITLPFGHSAALVAEPSYPPSLVMTTGPFS